MTPMTGVAALRLLEALKIAVDIAGQGEMRGMRLLARLHELGLDVCAVEMPPVPSAHKPQANGTGAEAAQGASNE